MNELSSPPAEEVIWLVAQRGDTPQCGVRARTWYEARRKGALALGVAEERVEAERMPPREGDST